MHGATGRAEWIWYAYRMPQPAPIRFFATRAFALAEKPGRALAKLFVDREHVLWVNGERAGAGQQQPGDPLALYEIASFLRAGENRVDDRGRESDGPRRDPAVGRHSGLRTRRARDRRGLAGRPVA